MAKHAAHSDEKVAGTSTVGKALEVLDLVYEFGRPVRFKELEARSRFPKPTLYRFVQTLSEHGMLSYDPDRNVYFLGTRLVRLAHAAWRHSRIAPVAQPHLQDLADTIGEAVYLSRLDGGHCVCIDRGSPGDLAGVLQDVNRVYPSYCTAVGKAMLAQLDEEALATAMSQQSFHAMTRLTITDPDLFRAELDIIRKRGFALENEEHIRGIIAIGVPVMARSGTLLGGLGIHAPDRRTDLETLKSQLPFIQQTADRIARDAADWSYPEAIQHVGT